MSILQQICADKRRHVSEMISRRPLAVLQDEIAKALPLRGFKTRIYEHKQDKTIGLIGEIKRASPSRGVIRWDFDPVQLAQEYEKAGASCLSVLTDMPYFHGKDEYIMEVKAASSLPILRKDFIVDSYQIYESRAIGADCILLIMAALTDMQVKEFLTVAREVDLDVLVEVHNLEELQRASVSGAKLIGVNNRDLNTLEVDVQTSLDLVGAYPPDVLKVAESGIKSYAEVQKLQEAGYNAILVGESLMRQDDLGEAVASLMGNA